MATKLEELLWFAFSAGWVEGTRYDETEEEYELQKPYEAWLNRTWTQQRVEAIGNVSVSKTLRPSPSDINRGTMNLTSLVLMLQRFIAMGERTGEPIGYMHIDTARELLGELTRLQEFES